MSREELTIELTLEERYKRDLEWLAALRPIDDDLMRELFRNNLPLAQVVLRIITGKKDLVLISQETQYDVKHLLDARSICLDVLATDNEGRKYNLEIQRSDKGAAPKRARYHSSAIDIEFLKASQDFDELPITYVIFITENDVRGKGQPIYNFSRLDEKTGEPFGDDEHIIFVNGAYQNKNDNSDLAKLIHDFMCSSADEMFTAPLAEKTRYCKEDPKGVSEMCKITEDIRDEAEQMANYRTAVNFLKSGKLSIKDIADGTELSIETVKALAEKYVPEALQISNK